MFCPFRNGWISNISVAILRHTHHENCAKNMTGLIMNSRVTAEERFDAYCYDEKGDYIHNEWSVTLDLCKPTLIVSLKYHAVCVT